MHVGPFFGPQLISSWPRLNPALQATVTPLYLELLFHTTLQGVKKVEGCGMYMEYSGMFTDSWKKPTGFQFWANLVCSNQTQFSDSLNIPISHAYTPLDYTGYSGHYNRKCNLIVQQSSTSRRLSHVLLEPRGVKRWQVIRPVTLHLHHQS